MQYARRSRQSDAATNVLPMPVPAWSTAARCGARHCTRTGACPLTAQVKSAIIFSGAEPGLPAKRMILATTAACHGCSKHRPTRRADSSRAGESPQNTDSIHASLQRRPMASARTSSDFVKKDSSPQETRKTSSNTKGWMLQASTAAAVLRALDLSMEMGSSTFVRS